MNFKYPKSEKLKHQKEISLLFEKGKWLTYENLRIVCLKIEDLEHQKIGVSVSKRYFKKAVDRNRIKRLLREVYRINKSIFVEKFGLNSISMLFWVSPNLPENYQEVEDQFLKLCRSTK